MRKVLNALRSKAGFISIETVIVAGLVIALGAYALTEFYATAQGTTEVSMDNVHKAIDVAIIGNPIP